ncbi:hypothetical protein J6590_087793 [Homalodisca vitripennis]|nr:hypothetical protein J6590_087793 [Homalodisca vitripennis]
MRKQYLQCYDSTFYNFAARGKRKPLPPPPPQILEAALAVTTSDVACPLLELQSVSVISDMSATLTRDRVKVTSTIVGEFIMIYTSLLEPRLLHRSLITRQRLHTDLHIVTEAETPSQIANYTPPAAHRSLITSHRPHTDLHIVTGAETPSQIANYTPPAAHRSTHPTGRTHIYTSLLEPRPLHRSLITRHRPHTDLHIVTGAETPSQIANYNSTGCTQIYTSLLERSVNHRSLITCHRPHTDRHIVTGAEPLSESLITRHRPAQIDTSLLWAGLPQIFNYPPPAAQIDTSLLGAASF